MTDYLSYVETLVSKRKTSGSEQSESLIEFTKLNLSRMKRWKKTGVLSNELISALQKINTPQKWVILTEAWCADSAHNFMFIEKMAAENKNITLEWKLRDENPELMDNYVTNNSRSIPKLIAFDQAENELFIWGPRPQKIQDEFSELRKNGMALNDAKVELQKMYNKDKGASLQKEILELIKKVE